MTIAAPGRSLGARVLVLALLAAALVAARRQVEGRRGLVFSVLAGSDGGPLRRVRIADPPRYEDFRSGFDASARAPFRVRYEGLLRVRRTGLYLLRLTALGGGGRLRLDGRELPLTAAAGGPGQAVLRLARGLHPLAIDFARDPGASRPPLLDLQWAHELSGIAPLPPGTVYRPASLAWRGFAHTLWLVDRPARAALAVSLLLLLARQRLPPASWQALASRLAALALGLGVVLALGEIGLRAAGVRPREYVPPLVWPWYQGFRPGSTATYVGWQPLSVRELEVPIAINAAGWRDREHALERPPGGYRVVVIGDSFVEAKEVPLEQGFPRRLEAELRAAVTGADGCPPVDVVALGRGGTGTTYHRRVLDDPALGFPTALDYRPDLVVLSFFPGNDVRESSPALTAENQRWGREVYAKQLAATRLAWLERTSFVDASYLNHFLTDRGSELNLRYLHLFRPRLRRADLVSNDVEVYRAGGDERRWAEAWAVVEEAIVEMRDAAAAHGAGFLVLVVSAGEPAGPGWDPGKPARRIAELGQRAGIPVVETAAPLARFAAASGRRFCWRFDGHWNADGHRVAAAELARAIRPCLAGGERPGWCGGTR